MDVTRFPYREEGNPPILRPTLDVELRYGPNGLWRTSALIDTGAPITVYDYGTAEALLIRFGSAGAETGRVALLGGHDPEPPPPRAIGHLIASPDEAEHHS